MKRAVRYLAIIFQLSLWILYTFPVAFADVKVKYDDSVFSARIPAKATLDSFSNDKQFHYKQSAVGKSLWERFKDWLNNLFHVKQGTFADRFLSEYLWYLLFFIIIVYVVYRFFKSDIIGLFSKKSKTIQIRDIIENVHELDFDRLIKENIANGRFRYAIRLYYLKTLKQLDDKELIDWQPQKTNREYLNELRNSNILAEFSRLTNIFNISWYGEFPIDEIIFRNSEQEFITFNQSILR